jgi:hypothetical protein
MTDGTHTHQCPFCELRFLSVNEVQHHVVTDHPEHARAFIAMAPSERDPHPHVRGGEP